MRAEELVVLTKAEFEALKRQAEAGADAGELFNAEEMQAIRDQYEERLTVETERREEIEWKLRMELAKIRDAELDARRAADEMRRIEQTLLSLLAEDDPTLVRSAVPSASLHPVAPKPQASRKSVQAPPLPSMEPRNGSSNGSSSNAEKFRNAMSHRKTYVA